LTTPNAPLSVDDHLAFLDEIIQDLFAKWKALSAHIDAWFEKEDQDIKALVPVFSVYGRTAICFGRLLRDRQALSPDKSKDLDELIDQALAELSEEWGIQLV